MANTTVSSSSAEDGCVEIRLNKSGYLPWDNPDNIISVEVERTIGRIRNNVLAVLFLIGGPANVVNMAVFYKQGLKDRVNLCLFALSLADGLFLLHGMFVQGEQIYQQFVTPEVHKVGSSFMANNNLIGFFGFQWVSQVLSAIIATERCLCICFPLKFQALLQTRTMVITIVIIYFLVVGFYFLVSVRYRIGCIYDSESGVVSNGLIAGEFYKSHKEFINYLDNVVYGAFIPGLTMLVVITMTLITSVKLRQIVTWRTGTSSTVYAREVALTKMLIGNSLLFIVCITPVGFFRVICFFMPDWDVGERNQNIYQAGLWIIRIFVQFNSTFNFFVYFAMGSRFRETFWTLFSRKRKLGTN